MRAESCGKLSFTAAYEFICNNEFGYQDRKLALIWEVKVPAKIQTFLWLQCRGFGDGAMISLLPGWRQHGLGRLSGSESIAKKATSSLRTFNMEEIWQPLEDNKVVLNIQRS
nr:hypothetical protein Itr_chr03CG08690 [Ipomoea trifida]